MIVLQGRKGGRRASRGSGARSADSGAPLVYNAPMDIPATLLYSILSAIAEAALAPAPTRKCCIRSAGHCRGHCRTRPGKGSCSRPQGDGFLTISGRQWPLAPTAQFRSRQNLLVLPMQIQDAVEVVYLTDASGAVYRVWMLTPTKRCPAPAKRPPRWQAPSR
jgi:hypothetical protein